MKDDLYRVKQLRYGDDVDVGRALRHAYEVVERGRQDGAHGLRQHDAKGLPRAWQAERRRRLVLALIDGEHAATDDFRREGRLVERETQHGGIEGRDQPRRVPRKKGDRGEGHADPDRLIEIAEIVEDQ